MYSNTNSGWARLHAQPLHNPSRLEGVKSVDERQRLR
jgi:hypothetical protein